MNALFSQNTNISAEDWRINIAYLARHDVVYVRPKKEHWTADLPSNSLSCDYDYREIICHL